MKPIKYTKRIGHLFERVVDIDNLKEAIKNAAKHKMNRPSVQRVINDLDKYAGKLQEMLITESFRPHKYTIREINDGIKKKKRIIAVPRFFPDQCVHHAFVQVFKEIVMHGAYEYSCGCVPGKGTDGARKIIEHWIAKDPVGLYTSPWFLNFFFQDLDHKLKEVCGVRHLTRYVDDIILFDSSKKRLHAAIRYTSRWLNKVKMRIKDTWQVFHLRIRPLDFLGYKFHKGWTTLRKSVMYRISRKAKVISKKEYISKTNASGMISYMGFIDHSDSHGFYEKWIQPFVNIKLLKGVASHENRKQYQTLCAA